MLLQLAGTHRFPVVNLELLNDDTPPPMPVDWSVSRCVSALVAGGADNFVIVGRADDPRLVKKVVIAPPGMSGADLARLVACEDPPPGYMMTPDGLLPIPEPPLEVPHDPARNTDPLQNAMTPEGDALAREAARWAAGIHDPVPVVLAPGEISPPTPPQPWLRFLQIEHPPLLPAVMVDPSVVNNPVPPLPSRAIVLDVPPPGPIKR